MASDLSNYKPLSLNVSSFKPTINCQSFTHQTFVNDSFVKVFPVKLFRSTVVYMLIKSYA